jgi:hypothetical protein
MQSTDGMKVIASCISPQTGRNSVVVYLPARLVGPTAEKTARRIEWAVAQYFGTEEPEPMDEPVLPQERNPPLPWLLTPETVPEPEPVLPIELKFRRAVLSLLHKQATRAGLPLSRAAQALVDHILKEQDR